MTTKTYKQVGLSQDEFDDMMALEPKDCTDYLEAALEAGVNPSKDKNIRLMIMRGGFDSQFFGQTFMPEHFYNIVTYQHSDMFDAMDDDHQPKTAICAWRGCGKSTISMTKLVQSVVYRRYRFIVVIGKTFEWAADVTEDLKQELITNRLIRYVWGGLKNKQYEGVELSFGRAGYYLCDPKNGEPFCFVVPRGAGQPVRGLIVRIMKARVRPELILVDDFEDDKEVDNEDLRGNLRKWFYSALMPFTSSDRPNPKTGRWLNSQFRNGGGPPWRFIFVDTLKHEDALLAHLLQDSVWRSMRHAQAKIVKVKDEHGKVSTTFESLVPEIISSEQVCAEAAEAREARTFEGWCREKLCIPVPPEYAAWRTEMFRYYDEGDVYYKRRAPGLSLNPDTLRFIIVDPAKTSKSTSAHTSILAAAATREPDNALYIRRHLMDHIEISKIPEETLKMARELGTNIICVEVTGAEDLWKHQFQTAAIKMGLFGIHWVWLYARAITGQGDYGSGRDAVKRARAAQVLPYYENGMAFHNKSLKGGALEAQMLAYPKPARWDGLDTAGYIADVLAELGWFWKPEFDHDEDPFTMTVNDGEVDPFDEAMRTGSYLLEDVVPWSDSGGFSVGEAPW